MYVQSLRFLIYQSFTEKTFHFLQEKEFTELGIPIMEGFNGNQKSYTLLPTDPETMSSIGVLQGPQIFSYFFPVRQSNSEVHMHVKEPQHDLSSVLLPGGGTRTFTWNMLWTLWRESMLILRGGVPFPSSSGVVGMFRGRRRCTSLGGPISCQNNRF